MKNTIKPISAPPWPAKPWRSGLRHCAILFLIALQTHCLIAAEKPNIILILLDDMGFSDLGCYGSEIDTPVIDKLAENGLRFTQFYSTAKCYPSRITAMTGLYETQAGGSQMSNAVTIAEALKPAGYYTAASGKWHLKNKPTERGFDRYWGHTGGATNLFLGDGGFLLDDDKWNEFGDDFYATDATADYGIQFMQQAIEQDKPFFLYAAFNAPHYPLQAWKKDIDKYEGVYDVGYDAIRNARFAKQKAIGLFDDSVQLTEKPPFMKPWDTLSDKDKQIESHLMTTYAAMIDSVDQNIGRMVNFLKKNGIYENTLIMLASDNGACPFPRCEDENKKGWEKDSFLTYDGRWATVSNTPFRMYKQNQHEGGIATPMIAHWPAGIKTKTGGFYREPGHLIDFMATCIEVSGAEYPSEFDGRKIIPLSGKSLDPIFKTGMRAGHDYIFFRFNGDRAFRQGDWKISSYKSGNWELYNMAEDRTEMNDLSDSNPEKRQELIDLWHYAAEHVDLIPEGGRKPVQKKLKQISEDSFVRILGSTSAKWGGKKKEK